MIFEVDWLQSLVVGDVMKVYLTNRFHVADCIGSVVDHRWLQMLMWYEQKRATWSNIWVYLWCSWHILMSCVLYYWTHSWQLGIYLSHPKKSNKILFFVLIKKELSRRLPHFDELVKISIWRNLLVIQNEETHWLLYESESDWL